MRRSGSLGVWLGKQREKEILKLCSNHIDRIIETVVKMREGVRAYDAKDVEGARALAKAASQAEKDADAIKRSILDELVREIFHPMDRDEILRLVLESDGIASNAKAAIGKLVMIPREIVEGSLCAQLDQLGGKLVECAQMMGQCFAALVKGSDDVFQRCHQVESLEEQIDDFRSGLIRNHFLPWCEGSNRVGYCIILKEAMDNMEKVADLAEDVADVVRGIAITSR